MSTHHPIHSALISIHDVMPEALAAVDKLLQELGRIPADRITLLIVPGRSWTQSDIAWLHAQQHKGYQLAGHGWLHHCSKPRSLYHHLHSWVLSRDVAEHLSLASSQIHALIARCHDWFADQGLDTPTLYVPPAWAMGNINRSLLQALPFGQYETLGGVYHSDSDLFEKLPLTGYEADMPSRAVFLRAFNRYQRLRAAQARLPLRIGIHPRDLQYRLASDLRRDINAVTQALNYRNYRRAALQPA